MDQSVVLGMEAATDSNRHVLDPEGLCVSVRVEAFLDESKTLELTIGVWGPVTIERNHPRRASRVVLGALAGKL